MRKHFSVKGLTYIHKEISKINVTNALILFLAQEPLLGQGLLIHEVSSSHTTTRHSR